MTGERQVSVVTIFLNAEKFIEEAVESVFAQTYANWELLLVDDGSTDVSTEIALTYAKQYPDKVRYFEHDGHKNKGMSATRNLGIRHSIGKYVALGDPDDVWLPNKLEEQVTILQPRPQVAMVCGSSQYWYSWTGIPEDLKRDYVCDLGVQLDEVFEPPALLNLFLANASTPCPSDLLIRRDIFERVAGFEESFTGVYQLYEDQAFLAKVYLKENVFVASECWDRYRIHPGSCDSVVTEAGEAPAARLFFLNWLEGYLSQERVEDTQVWANLRNALGPYRNSIRTEKPKKGLLGDCGDGDLRQMNWWLRVSEGNLTTLEFLPGGRDVVRMAIEKARTGVSHDIQLNEPRLKVRQNHRYAVNSLARADKHRSIFLGFAKGHPPWSNLGLYRKIALTTEWQTFEEQFVATADAHNARLHFDAGDVDISVELAAVSLRSLPDGRCIEPRLPAV